MLIFFLEKFENRELYFFDIDDQFDITVPTRVGSYILQENKKNKKKLFQHTDIFWSINKDHTIYKLRRIIRNAAYFLLKITNYERTYPCTFLSSKEEIIFASPLRRWQDLFVDIFYILFVYY